VFAGTADCDDHTHPNPAVTGGGFELNGGTATITSDRQFFLTQWHVTGQLTVVLSGISVTIWAVCASHP
jgi:hypothetical protein